MLDIDACPYEVEYSKTCYVWVATAIIGGSALTALASAYSAHKASEAQKSATNKAADTALSMFNKTEANLAPYRATGVDAANRLGANLDFLTSPIKMDQDALEQTPGYQFTKTQGLKAVQNSAAARGLGNSGAALKGAANFATGLADQTYKTQFDIENINRGNAFNRLSTLLNTGANAAAQTGTAGTNAANTAAQAQIAGGNAQAAGINAIGGAFGDVGKNIAGYGLYRGIYGGGAGGGAGEPGGGPSPSGGGAPV